jgi:hypothetical protein
MPSARLYIPEDIYHEMNEKGYLKAVPIRNILQIGIAQYDQWVAEGLDPNQRLAKIELGPEVSELLERKGYTHH